MPNEYVHAAFGKMLFVLADLVIGYLIYALLRNMGHASHMSALSAATWLLNPIAINVSTRGNADSLVGLFVLATLYLLGKDRITIAAIMCVCAGSRSLL